jgi:hypothetical protein
MESLNLNTLVSSLPSQQNAEKQLMNDFKGLPHFCPLSYHKHRADFGWF